MKHLRIKSDGLQAIHARVFGVDDNGNDQDLTEQLKVYKIEIDMKVGEVNRAVLYCYSDYDVDVVLDRIERKYIDKVPD